MSVSKQKRTGHKWLSFRRKVGVIVVGLVIGGLSLVFTNSMARQLRQKEQAEVRLWALFRANAYMYDMRDPIVGQLGDKGIDIPYVITDGMLNVRETNIDDEGVKSNPGRMRQTIDRFAARGNSFDIPNPYGGQDWMFYGQSRLLRMLTWFPFIQLLVIAIFAMFGYITFRSSKDYEQNRVWIGLAKETAHQLGTPTSSLLGWLEYLRSQPVDQTAVEEMNKDITRLMKVVDRFSKIGSETALSPANINEVVGSSVLYFRTRIPRNVTLTYNGLAIAPVQADINEALFEWVVENLLKNSLDALQGKGAIDVRISSDDDWVNIDVSDTGKGIAKANFKRIFDPGFTTKTRGWGLGLSLSRRIIETYHRGKIYVVDSEVGRGTTIRIALRKTYS